jgi:hypothetical protein
MILISRLSNDILKNESCVIRVVHFHVNVKYTI